MADLTYIFPSESRIRSSSALIAFAAAAAISAAALRIHPLAAIAVLGVTLALVRSDFRLSRTVLFGVYAGAALLFPGSFHLTDRLPVDLTVERAALAVLLAAWLLGALELRPGWPEGARRLTTPLAAVLLVALLSVVVNAPALHADGTLIVGLKRVSTLVSYVLTFSVVVALVRTRAEALRALRVLVGLGAVAAVFGILERIAGFNPIRQLAPVTEEIAADMIRGSGERVFGTAAHPIEFGAMMSVLLPVAVYLLFASSGKKAAAKWGLASALIGLAMLFSVSRSSLIAALAGFGCVLLLSKRRGQILALALVAAFCVHIVFPGLFGTLRAALDPAAVRTQELTSNSGRLNDYPVVRGYVARNPLLGLGYGTFDPHKYFFLDNQWLKFLLEFGILGTAAIAWFFASVLHMLWRAARRSVEDFPVEAALLAGAVAFVVLSALFDTFGFYGVTVLFFAVAGLAVPLCSAGEPGGTAEEVPDGA